MDQVKKKIDQLFDIVLYVAIVFSVVAIICFVAGAVIETFTGSRATLINLVNALLAGALVAGLSFFFIKLQQMRGEQ